MGSHTPRALKKRASPPPIDDSDGESPQKRSRPEEADGKETTSVASRISAAASVPNDLGLKPPECGVITEIYCENFMCHRKLRVELCRNVNFIYGQNGSGKSAILAAIQICLGAGARRTHRARNLKDLVRKDSNTGYAKVRVTLLNKGDDAYKHEIYGDKITVERTIATRGGYNGYKLYDANGKERSKSKKDLDEFLDKVNAQVENPVAILDQEEAKKFLTGKAEDKYSFFMKATELERIDRNIASTMDRIMELQEQEKRMEQTLEADEELMKETKKQYDQHKEIEKMKRKLHGCEEALAWAMHKEANELLQEEVEKIRQFREKAAKRQEELTQAEASTQEGDAEEIALRNKVEELTKECGEQADRKREAEQELKRAAEPLKGMKRNLKNLMAEKGGAIRALSSARQRLEEKRREIIARAGSAESEAARRNQKIEGLEHKIQEAKEKYDQTKQDLTDLHRATEELSPHVEQARNNVAEAKRKLNAVEGTIGSLQSSSGSPLAVFGQRCGQLKQAIEKERRFRGPVLGPIGAYLKIMPGKEHFAALAESALGNGVLDRFIVTNDHDRKLLQSLRQKIGCQTDCGIFQVATHNGRYKVPGSPVEGIETVESTFNIADDLVFNCLVDNCKIEERALARSKEESERKLLVDDSGKLTIRGKVKNVFFLPRGDNWSIKGSNISMVANHKELGKGKIGLDKTAALAEARREAASIKENLKDLSHEESKLEHEHHEKQKAWTKAKRENRALQDVINKLTDEIDSIKSEQDTAVNFDTDTSDLEQDVENAQQELDALSGREEKLKDDIATKEPEVAELEARLEEVTTRNKKVLEETDVATKELTRFMNGLSQRDRKLEKKRDKLKQLQEIVEQQEAKISEITDDVKKYLKFSRRLAYARMQRDEEEEKVGGEQEADPSQFSQEPTDEELEAIEVNDVERESKYYKARAEKLRKNIEKEKERRNANKEDALAAFEKYKRAKEIYEGKVAQLEEVSGVMRRLTEDVRQRKKRWEHFRKHIADKTSIAFDEILNQKGSSGTVEFDFENQSLDLIVQKDSADANSQQKDVKALSGGERSYTTIALLLALGESLETPFRILDEFDVFLDPVTRKLTIEALIQMAKSMSHRQFVFITPQDVSNVNTDPMLKIVKMNPPERRNVVGGPTQQTLDFSEG